MDMPIADHAPHKRVQSTLVEQLKQQAKDRPSLQELIAQSRERAQQRKDQFTPSLPKRYGDIPLDAYARLSRARTQAETSAAAGYARRGIAQLKVALRQDEGNSAQIRAAIGQLQKAVLRSGRKRNELGREALAQRHREQAAAREQERETLRQHSELQRKRALRLIREGGYLTEAAISHRLASQADQARAALAPPTQALPVGPSAAPPAAVPPAAVPPAAVPQAYLAGEPATPAAAFTAQA